VGWWRSLHAPAGDYVVGDANYARIMQQLLEQSQAAVTSNPVQAAVLEAMPTVVVTKETLGILLWCFLFFFLCILLVVTEELGDTACAVCHGPFEVDETLRKLPCTHPFHQDCILPWLGSVRGH
jgi:hypothetical protein